ncbi:MAG: porphobilinogen synthase [Armatimonadota bacterium]
MSFPATRLRRLRRTPQLRSMVRETRVSADQLIYPLFVTAERSVRRQIPSMPGCYQVSADSIAAEVEQIASEGISAVLLFGIPESKDPLASEAYADDGVVQRAVREIKTRVPQITVVTDVCLCEYTSHGHCGPVDETGYVVNDQALELLARTAVSHAVAGADIVAPSDMMDGRVAAIRSALDQAGFANTPIMAYSAKFASAFYGPFREAAESAPQFGDRRQYQMDPPNRREAMREIELDLGEGADIVMVKPALAYLDVIREARDAFDVPIAAYNVSGEYSMVKAAASAGWIDERRVVYEILTGIVRAGADIVITYHARDVIQWMRDGTWGQ